MSDTHIQSSITDKLRQVHPPTVPAKQVENISLAAYQEAVRPPAKQEKINVKIDPSKFNRNK